MFGINGECIRQRVLVQAANHVGKSGALLELFQCLVAGDKFGAVYGRMLCELLAQLVNVIGLRIHVQEQADLRRAGDLRDQALRVLQQHIHAGRQAECDADDQYAEQTRQPGCEHAPQYPDDLSECVSHACNSPCLTASTRTLVSCSTLSSWVEISSVTPT